MLDASAWMLNCAATFDLCPLTSTLDVGRWAFLLRFRYGETSERLPRRSLRRRRVGRFLLLSDV